jgi:hypothetical protein
MGSLASFPATPQRPIMAQLRKSLDGTLDPADAYYWEICKNLALGHRTFEDAELLARDMFAQQFYGNRTFNGLSLEEQRSVAEAVACVAANMLFYLSGYAEPISDWQREQVMVGAKASA